jgi:hypothetical protein
MLRFGEASSRSARWVRTQGFALATEPEGAIPELPADITAPLDKDIMVLFENVRSWLDYVEVAYTAATIDYEQSKLDEARLLAVEQIRNKSEKNVTTAKAMAFSNPDYVAKKEEVNLHYGRAKMIETVYNSLDRKKFIISREISRRQNDRTS